jgi:hypothetical protein
MQSEVQEHIRRILRRLPRGKVADCDRRILEHIATELGRLQQQAQAVEGQDLLAYLINVAMVEARDALAKRSDPPPPAGPSIFSEDG